MAKVFIIIEKNQAFFLSTSALLGQCSASLVVGESSEGYRHQISEIRVGTRPPNDGAGKTKPLSNEVMLI